MKKIKTILSKPILSWAAIMIVMMMAGVLAYQFVPGINTNVNFEDKNGNNITLHFEDGVLQNYTINDAPGPELLTSALKEELISYYKLDETSGTLVVDENENYNGTSNGTSVGQDGIIYDAYNFVPSSNFESQMPAFFRNDNFTLSAWINPDTTGVDRTIMTVGKDKNQFAPNVYYKNDGTIVFQIQDLDTDDTTILNGGSASTGSWTHVVATYNGGTRAMELYVDGTNVDSDTDVSDGIRGSAGFLVGASYYWSSINNNNNFDGQIDEVGVWNRTLNSTEISELYNLGYGLTY